VNNGIDTERVVVTSPDLVANLSTAGCSPEAWGGVLSSLWVLVAWVFVAFALAGHHVWHCHYCQWSV